MSNDAEVTREAIDLQFQAAGHRAEVTSCNHKQWTFQKHGRYCPCGTCMIDFGD